MERERKKKGLVICTDIRFMNAGFSTFNVQKVGVLSPLLLRVQWCLDELPCVSLSSGLKACSPMVAVKVMMIVRVTVVDEEGWE